MASQSLFAGSLDILLRRNDDYHHTSAESNSQLASVAILSEAVNRQGTQHLRSMKESLNLQSYDFVKDPSENATNTSGSHALDHSHSLLRGDSLHRKGTGPMNGPSRSVTRETLGNHLSTILSRDSTIGATTEFINLLKASASNASNGTVASSGQNAMEETNAVALSSQLPTAMERSHWSLKDFELLRKVHRGYASDVYEAICKQSKERVAVKVYSISQLDEIPRVQLSREIRLHSKINHPNIVQFYAAFVDEDVALTSEKEAGPSSGSKAMVLVVEWAGRGNLLKFMQKQGGSLSEAKAINLVLMPLLSALFYLHSQGIVHRDIKPENCLFDDNMVLKMADFGLSVDITEERANTRAGTLDYMAPEVLLCPTKNSPADFKYEKNSKHYATGADAWAVGAIFFELLSGQTPFHGSSMTSTARKILNGEVNFPSKVSDSAKRFILSCLEVEPINRPTVVELMEHDLLTVMRRRASYRAAAMRSNSFVEFIQQQSVEELKSERRESKVGNLTATDPWLQDAEEEEEEDLLFSSTTAFISPPPGHH